MSTSRYSYLKDNASPPLADGSSRNMTVTRAIPKSPTINGAVGNSMSSGSNLIPRTTIEHRLRPTLWILQVFGYFPLSLNPKAVRKRRWAVFSCFTLYISGLAMVNFYLFGVNITTISLYVQMFDLLHAQTVSSIINGLKPFINFVCMTIFWFSSSRHRKFLKQLSLIDRIYSAEFGASPCVRTLNIFAIVCTFLVMLVMVAARLIEFVYMGESLGAHWLIEFSLVMVPLLTVWIVVPLIYFEVCNRMVRFWCRQLQTGLKQNGVVERKPIKYYYERFLKLTDVQFAMSNLFSPFILFSLGWSVFTLCLTIYFLTQSDTHFPPAPTNIEDAPQGQEWINIVSFNLMYGSLQVLLAAACICIICFTGTRTNEETRYTLKWLLANLPDDDLPADRFYVTCFMYKISTQYMWGVTVWRAFPLERSAFFTLVSLILTYAFLLLKFRQGRMLFEETNQLNTTMRIIGLNINSTY